MINNDYKFSLELYLRITSIDNLMTFSSLKSVIKNYYRDFFDKEARRTFRKYHLQLPTLNSLVSKEDFMILKNMSEEVLGKIKKALNGETRKNVIVATKVLEAEFEAILKLFKEQL